MPRPLDGRARLQHVKRKDGFAPIGAYAAIGDGRTVALVAADGSIDFMSVPSLHSPTVFAALLDPERGGRFVLQPTGRFDVERRYVERTNVLETVYTTNDGGVRVTEALTLQGGGLVPWRELARRVDGLSGEVELRWRLEPRFDWGREQPTIRLRGETPVAEGCRVHLAVHSWEAGRPALEDDAIAGSCTVRGGESALLAMTASYDEPIPIPTREAVERRLRETAEVWRRWLEAWEYDGPWQEQVTRSALALKLLVYTPDAAIVAAPTTSLPERIGGDKNYDYRYMWVRDAAFTLDAFMRLGLPEQVHESFCFLLRVVRATAPELRPFYSIDGHVAHRREELPLRGYRDSRPVRYGNAAADQLQLGTYGDLIETAGLYVEHGNSLGDETANVLAKCLDRVAVIWEDNDSGIWELDDMRDYTASMLSVWMAFDRALALAERGELPSNHAHVWRAARERVRDFVERRCWSDELGAYVEYAGADSLDAAVLRAARMGWTSVAQERFERTVDAIAEGLDAGECLLYRTTRERGHEGAFVACSFWLVDALARLGRVDEAATRFERLLGHGNDLGLFSEEVDPGSGELLGNFPQGLSHLALINAAGAIQDARAAGASATAGAARR
jgi:GH15 family glucan-1,4-alpha-glucosidase